MSIFGGIVSFNRTVDAKIANELIIFGYTEGNYYNIFFVYLNF